MKNIIINADDFGHSRIFNEVILDLAKKGYISSTSVMVERIGREQDAQVEELKSLKKEKKIEIGLHYEFVHNNDFNEEVVKQFNKFINIFGFSPTHLDLHKSTYLEDSYPLIMKFGEEKGIPYRNHDMNESGLPRTSKRSVDCTRKSMDEIKKAISDLSEEESVELVFHPGKYDPESKSSLNKEREDDARKIIDLNMGLDF